MTQYVGSNNNIIDVEHDPGGVSVGVYIDPADFDVDVPLTGIPELVEVLLDAPDGAVPAVVRFTRMFDRPDGQLVPPAVGALRLVAAFLRRLDAKRDYETWDGQDCETVAEILDDIAEHAAAVRPRLT